MERRTSVLAEAAAMKSLALTAAADGPPPAPRVTAAPVKVADVWTDARLVSQCLKGNEDAWSALLEKYKRLIYSIPIKYGLSVDQATDVFQEVCVELLSE